VRHRIHIYNISITLKYNTRILYYIILQNSNQDFFKNSPKSLQVIHFFGIAIRAILCYHISVKIYSLKGNSMKITVKIISLTLSLLLLLGAVLGTLTACGDGGNQSDTGDVGGNNDGQGGSQDNGGDGNNGTDSGNTGNGGNPDPG
jgi:hypothetical protein